MKWLCIFLFIITQHISLMLGEDTGTNSANLHQKMERFSRREGYDIAAGLKTKSDWIDLPCVIQGIQDYIAGQEPENPSNEGASYCSIIVQLFEQTASINLQNADSFLQTLKDRPNLHSLEDGKVLYEVEVEGKSSDCVQNASTPLLHYSIGALDDNAIMDTRRRCRPERVPLTETIQGFAKGVVGMHLGERRKIYIHPELGYGKWGYVPPNSLLIVDVEVVDL